MPKAIDITGEKYGRLFVKKMAFKRKNHKYYHCICDCGNKSIVKQDSLRTGHTISCGCYNREINRGKKYNFKHGDYKNRLYNIWHGMRSRCRNKDNLAYGDYGGRGISVCDDWVDDYQEFKEWALKNGYNEELTIERIDVNGNYEPGNCKWIPRAEQNKNKRNLHFIEYKGERHHIAEWARITGINRGTILKRIKMGWKKSDLFKEVK